MSPVLGTVGTAISVNGQNLNPVLDETTTFLTMREVLPTSATNTKIVFPIPANVGSGKVTVMTTYGTVTSNQDILVTPAGIAPTAVSTSKVGLVDDAYQTFSVTAVGNYAAEVFDANANAFLTVQFTSMAAGNVNYSLYDTNNVLVVSGTASPTAPSGSTCRRCQVQGLYLLLMQPAAATATWRVSIETDKTIPIDGSSLAVATTVANQGKRFVVNATAGANLGLALSNLVTPGSTTQVIMSVNDANGLSVGSALCYAPIGCDFNLPNVIAGTYTIPA